ncbi:hypothetical protein B0T19DRAFT_228071 [Cercophora scortea]|uniref:Ring-like domain-containing protein n=1 Tax=Cercophora scortea TaxID=314031 RepID=A0AAE0IGI8_9PEZI|nr:hypothetical protein B0T19DRAFT_228071 [Cercophora scortea]
MLEYFAYKKFKKNKAEKLDKGKGKEDAPATTTETTAAGHSGTSTPQVTPLLDDDDERFLEHLTSPTVDIGDDDDAGSRPPLPPRVQTPDLTWDSDADSFRKVTPDTTTATTTASKDKEVKKPNRLSILLRRNKKPDLSAPGDSPSGSSQLAVPSPEVDREKDDLSRVLEDLNLSARNNKVFALSTESTALMRDFTLVLKDLVNGVPTAVNDLTSLLEDRDGKLAKHYEKLPSSLKKLVTQLPEKLSSTLAPELLAVAAEAQGVATAEAAATGGLKGAAKRLLTPRNIKDLVTKPGAVVSMLKGIVNALKLRWPAFIGTNAIWSLALFLLLMVLWYCHKRGREVRLDKEKAENVVDGSSRIEELPDDPALPAPGTATPAAAAAEPRR